MRAASVCSVLIAALSMGSALGQSAVGARPVTAYLTGLSFEPQTFNNCGPAAVSSVLGYYGIQKSQEDVRRMLRPGSGYMRADVIAPYLRAFRLRATRFKQGNAEHVRRLVASGVPVLILQWLNREGGIPHFRVVRGYDDKARVFYFSDPYYGPSVYVSYADFERLWTLYGQEFIPVYREGQESQIEQILGIKGLPRT